MISVRTERGSEQKIKIYNKPLLESKVKSIEKIPNREEAFKKDLEEYGSLVSIPDWKEVSLVYKGDETNINPEELSLSETTSYHIQAIRKLPKGIVTPLSACGIVMTPDNKIVLGVRGGRVESGKISNVPLGNVSYSESEDMIFGSLEKEMIEELGINDTYNLLLGQQTDPDFTKSMNFVFLCNTKTQSSEIYKKHKEALSIYLDAKKDGKYEHEAIQEIAKRGFDNVDAWEHSQMVLLDNDNIKIDKLIKEGSYSDKNKKYPLLDIGRGALIIFQKYIGKPQVI